ncbi:hypothetical protein [Nocardioides sp.]|uniref:hypothetical protein n=1 Tax=Nocardioides sp. TaxID=35761 RepID=UPI0031FF1E9B
MASRPLSNFDTYFHLRFGHEFLNGWSLRHPGSVSTFATADWVPTQWLPEVVMAQTEDWFGLAGVAWLSGLQLCTLALVLYWSARRWADPLAASVVVVVALIASGSGLSMRPQVISYILVALTVGAWIRARETGRVPWFLIPVTWIWAMSHGMWPIGILTGLLAVAGLRCDGLVRGRELGRHLAVPVLAAVAAALTPVGPGLYPAVLLVTSRAQYFSEWGPPDFTSPNGLALVLLIAVAAAHMFKRGANEWFDILMLLMVGGWAVYSSRTVPVAAAMVAPFAARALQAAIGPMQPADVRERLLLWSGYSVALLSLAVIVPHTADEPPAQPAWVTSSLAQIPSNTPVLNDMSAGGYLMWRFPQLDLMLHGYGDTFTTSELDRAVDMLTLEPGWDTTLRESDARFAVLDPATPLAYALEHEEGWEVVHESDSIELLEPPPGWFDQ